MQLILNAKDGVGALIQRRGKDTQTEVMKQRLCVPAAARTYSAAFKERMWGFLEYLVDKQGQLARSFASSHLLSLCQFSPNLLYILCGVVYIFLS